MSPQSHLLACPLCGHPLAANLIFHVDVDGHIAVAVDRDDQATINDHIATHTKVNCGHTDN